MPGGGTLTLECTTRHSPQTNSDLITIRITDTGVGIDPEILPRIFDPFFTTKEVGSGTGLGLAVSRRIVEEHLGWMEAENNPSGGAVFTINIPLESPGRATLPGEADEDQELALAGASAAATKGASQ
jgi:two-component system cell cycle sensor histidine kinase/response regulator CckA